MSDIARPAPETLPPNKLPERQPLLRVEFWCALALIAMFFLPWFVLHTPTGVQRFAGYQVVNYLRMDPQHVGLSGAVVYLGLLSWLVPLTAFVAVVLDLIKRPINWLYFALGSTPLFLAFGGIWAEVFPTEARAMTGFFAPGFLASVILGIAAVIATGVGLIIHLRRLSVGTENDPKYRVGTLQYSLVTLVTMFGWMMWGGFCVDLMEKVFPVLFPLQVRDMGGNNKIVSILSITLPNILVFTVVPAVSFRSDRTRTRLGRRIPYILYTAPFLAAFLIALGWSVPIGDAVKQADLHASFYVAPKTVALVIIGIIASLVLLTAVRWARAGANGKKFIPFLVLAGVFISLSVAAVAYSPAIAGHLNRLDLRNTLHISPAVLAITIIGVLVAAATALIWRNRRRTGRSGPSAAYVVFGVPFIALLLLSLSYSPAIAAYLQRHNLPGTQHITPLAFALFFVGLLVAGFQFFHMFVASVNYYLMADVVPTAFLGRYQGMGRILAIVVGMGWDLLIFPQAERHMTALYVGAGALYFLGLTVMCLRVKEGKYPPVTDVGHRTTLVEKFSMYFRECFTHPFFILLFLANMSTTVSNASNFMRIFFLRDHLHLNYTTIGRINAFLALIPLVLAYPVGAFIDKAHALRVMILGILLFIPVSFFGFWVMHPGITSQQGTHNYIIYMLLLQIPDMLRDAALIPLFMCLFPRDRYGQFSSANAMLRSMAQFVFPVIAGAFMDVMIRGGTHLDNYRYIFFWNGTFQIVSLGMYVWLFMYWKKLGGDKGYTPPDTTKKEVPEPFAEAEKV